MAEKKYLIKNGEKVVIEIQREAADRSPKPEARSSKGILKPRKDSEYLARRLNPSGMTFYDLGQMLVDSVWTDNLFSADRNVSHDGEFVSQDSSTSLPDETAKADALVAEQDNFTSKFKQITRDENADKFRLGGYTNALGYFGLNSDSELWQSNGNKADFSDADLAEGFYLEGEPFSHWFYVGTDGNKVTASNDYEADNLPDFRVKKSDQIFLVPAFCKVETYVSGQMYDPHDRPDFNPDADYFFFEHLYPDFLTFPRVYFDDRIADWYPEYNKTIGHGGIYDTPGNYELLFEQIAFLKLQAATKFYKSYSYQTFDGGVVTHNIVEDETLADYPITPLYPDPPDMPDYETYGEPIQYKAAWQMVDNIAGALCAILRQNGQFYYVWS